MFNVSVQGPVSRPGQASAPSWRSFPHGLSWRLRCWPRSRASLTSLADLALWLHCQGFGFGGLGFRALGSTGQGSGIWGFPMISDPMWGFPMIKICRKLGAILGGCNFRKLPPFSVQ